ncbi:MAG: hypothetical protein AAB953_00475 [Patescibacteria group bacterium]
MVINESKEAIPEHIAAIATKLNHVDAPTINPKPALAEIREKISQFEMAALQA